MSGYISSFENTTSIGIQPPYLSENTINVAKAERERDWLSSCVLEVLLTPFIKK